MDVVSLLRSNGVSNGPLGVTVASLGGKVQVLYRCFHGTQIQGILQYGTHISISSTAKKPSHVSPCST
jgi:hypothetical protein